MILSLVREYTMNKSLKPFYIIHQGLMKKKNHACISVCNLEIQMVVYDFFLKQVYDYYISMKNSQSLVSIFSILFCLNSWGCHNYDANIGYCGGVKDNCKNNNMKITTNYTVVTKYNHNLTPNVVVTSPWLKHHMGFFLSRVV